MAEFVKVILSCQKYSTDKENLTQQCQPFTKMPVCSFSRQFFICQAILPESVRNPPQQQQQARPFTGSKTAGQGVLFTDSLNPEALNSLESAYSRLQVSFLGGNQMVGVSPLKALSLPTGATLLLDWRLVLYILIHVKVGALNFIVH